MNHAYAKYWGGKGGGGGKSSSRSLWFVTEGIFLLWGRVIG